MFNRPERRDASMALPTFRWPLALAPVLLLGAAPPPAPEGKPLQFAQVVIREQIVVRVPMRLREAPPPAPIRWREGRGPKCVAARDIAGATLLSEDSVDLILRDKRRIRARLSSRCPALAYYRGFYVRPTEDGMICAERDIIRSRMGGQCEIERFRSLKAVAAD